MELLSFPEIFERLVLAIFLGMLLGFERLSAGKTAGARTHALISLGAALFVIVSVMVSGAYQGAANFDPLRVAAQIVAGIGFLGAGIIIFTGSQLKGLTTAAGFWVAAGIGMATGYGLWTVAVSATVLTLFVFTVLWYIERIVKNISEKYSHKK